MELTIRGVLSMKDREYVTSFHNGHTINEVIERLYEDGLTSEIRVIGHMDAVSYVVTQYEVYIVQDGHTMRVQASDLRHLNSVVNSLKEQVANS